MEIKFVEARVDRDAGSAHMSTNSVQGLRELVIGEIKNAIAEVADTEGGKLHPESLADEIIDHFLNALDGATVSDTAPFSTATTDSIETELDRAAFLPTDLIAIVKLDDLRSLVSLFEGVTLSSFPNSSVIRCQ